MKSIDYDTIRDNLANELKKYILAIIERYGEYIPRDRLFYLQNIKNFDDIIKIWDHGSINAFANNEGINMPLAAEKVLKTLSKIPGYGINKNNRPYTQENLIINDNTFMDYIKHSFISGKDVETYYKDLLLHETMHYCGSGGARALKEGINELLTRKLAFEKNFKQMGVHILKRLR